mgnify:CR=1 FL=1
MSRQIFVNLPVKDLNKAIAFFAQLGFTFNPQFTDNTATCMVISDDISVMLLTEAKFQTFTPKALCDATKNTKCWFVCPVRAAQKWMTWCARLLLPVARLITIRKTMALCMHMVTKIWTGIFGS